MLELVQHHDVPAFVTGVVAYYTAYSDALERVLGAPEGCLPRLDAAAASAWATRLRSDG